VEGQAAVGRWPKRVGHRAEGVIRFWRKAGRGLRTEAACLQLNLWMRGLA
jgi:hypothetical protein